MKANVKNAGLVQSILLNHAEKIVMVVVLLGAGWLLYGSLSPKGESRAPTELSNLVSNAQNKLDKFTADNAPTPEEDPTNALLNASDYQDVAAKEISYDHYATPDPWDTSPVPPTVLRTDPVLLSAEDLEGFGFTALIATLDPEVMKNRAEAELRKERQRDFDQEQGRNRDAESMGRMPSGRFDTGDDKNRRAMDTNMRRRQLGVATSGNERIDLVSFAAVTALVPVKDQFMQYRDSLENALGYNRQSDVPQWLGYLIERTEVTSDGKENWTRVRVPDRTPNGRGRPNVSQDTIQRATADWAPGMEPLMDRNYFHPELTFPLPPLVGKNFGREVVHSKVPLQAETEALAAERGEADETKLPASDDPEALLLGGGDNARSGRGPGMPGGRPGGMRGPMGGMPGYGPPMAGRGGPMERMGRMGPGRSGATRGGGGALGGDFSFSEPYAMLRFFDFDVVPGKRYRYRVRLIIIDVNAKGLVNSNHLDKAVRERVANQKDDGKPKYRLTEWSKPSRIVSVPAAGEVLVASAKPAPTRSPNGEPTAELLIKSYEVTAQHRARQAEKIMTFRRGAVLNRTEDDVWIPDDEGHGRSLVKVETFPFRTNATLLDISGGQKLGRDTTEPARVLVMDVSGKITVADELSALEDLEIHRDIYEESDEKPNGRMGPMMRGRGGGGFIPDFGGRR